MANVPFINYKEPKEFYTIPEVYKLFNTGKAERRKKCEKYGIEPRRDEIGEYGFAKYDVRKLHNTIVRLYVSARRTSKYNLPEIFRLCCKLAYIL